MEPAYKSGEVLRVSRMRRPALGDVVVVRDPRDGREILKRVVRVEEGKFVVEGDNSSESTDSRAFGPVHKKAIVGKVVRGGRI